VKTIQIRNVPDDVHAAITARANVAGLSLSDYLLGEIERVAARSRMVEVLGRADSRRGGVSREEIRTALDEARSAHDW